MLEFTVIGILLFLVWLFLYFKYFRENGQRITDRGDRQGTGEENYYSVAPWGDDENTGAEKSSEESPIEDRQGTGEKHYYSVASWGDDGNSGGIDAPWHTLEYAVNQLAPGDTLLIRGGSYREHVVMKQSGTGESPIVVRVFQGEEAELDGERAGWKYGFNFASGASFVTLADVKVKGFAEYGFALWGDNRGISLLDLEAFSCGTGLRIISATDLLVEGCNFYNNNAGLVISPGPVVTARIKRTRSCGNEGPGMADGFVLDSGEDIVIEKCYAEYNAGNGFNCLTGNTVISAGVARENGAHGINCSGDGYRLVNCIVDGNGMAGVFLHGEGKYELYNNLTIKCGLKGDYGLAAVCEANPSAARVSLVNNIFAHNYGGVYLSGSAVLEKEDHNIFWSREDAEIATGNYRYGRKEINGLVWFKETGRGEHSFCRDPLFIDPASHDFRLFKNSPAIDRGTGEGAPSADINGSIRPQGGGFDIGPYESAEGSIVPPSAGITHCPAYSTDTSSNLEFIVGWDGSLEGGTVTGFMVQVRDGADGTWYNWLEETDAREAVFLGVSSHTYYFRVRARDDLGNWGNWSDQRCTVVPADDRSPLIKYEGAWDGTDVEGTFMNTLHFSATRGASASLRFTGEEVAWISVTGPDRGQAQVFIDGVLQDTVDLYSESHQALNTVFTKRVDGKPHTFRIQVGGTKNEQSTGYRVDVDGIAIKA